MLSMAILIKSMIGGTSLLESTLHLKVLLSIPFHYLLGFNKPIAFYIYDRDAAPSKNLGGAVLMFGHNLLLPPGWNMVN